jgi:hypothetical protein
MKNVTRSSHDVVIVIPKPNDWLRESVLIAQGAHAGRIQENVFAQ